MASCDYNEQIHMVKYHDQRLENIKHNDPGQNDWSHEINIMAFGRRLKIGLAASKLSKAEHGMKLD
jgi:hypothetical protein